MDASGSSDKAIPSTTAPRRVRSESVEKLCQKLSNLQYPLPCLFSPNDNTKDRPKPRLPPEEIKRLRQKLSRIQYHVTQERGTETRGTGQYLKLRDTGMYHCVVCDEELFSSQTKFESGCGWPAFYDITDKKNIHVVDDKTHGMVRTEVLCASCGAHLGHVFKDGYGTPTGQRYCVNSASLQFHKVTDGSR